ncbi:MAG: peptidoglycan editing factor PgeF [Xanthomonadaceae bacterium]|nr:peptidoglycan editing factor PgeF [Xanthomonadaceae bacterium]
MAGIETGRERLGALYPDWPAPPGVHALTTLRCSAGASLPPYDSFNMGARCGDDPQAVSANRAELRRRFRLPCAPAWLRQVHGIEVARIGQPPPEDDVGEPEADAAMTDAPGVVLAILTADCLPVVFAAKDGTGIAAAHAGWRGLVAGMLERTLAAMRAQPEDVIAWLGPAAGPARYEIGREVHDAFTAQAPAAASAFAPTRPGQWMVDLYALARLRLIAAGMAAGDIHGGGLCTISDPQRFYSYRRDRETGRMATLIWMRA